MRQTIFLVPRFLKLRQLRKENFQLIPNVHNFQLSETWIDRIHFLPSLPEHGVWCNSNDVRSSLPGFDSTTQFCCAISWQCTFVLYVAVNFQSVGHTVDGRFCWTWDSQVKGLGPCLRSIDMARGRIPYQTMTFTAITITANPSRPALNDRKGCAVWHCYCNMYFGANMLKFYCVAGQITLCPKGCAHLSALNLNKVPSWWGLCFWWNACEAFRKASKNLWFALKRWVSAWTTAQIRHPKWCNWLVL